LLIALILVVPALAQEKPRSGGELVFPVPSEPPSYDGHREETFGLTHPFAPFYNTLIRVDPNDPSGTKPAPSLAESWTISSDGRVYTFKLQRGV
jgi:peptide/nickel transport system substrate-binding protein